MRGLAQAWLSSCESPTLSMAKCHLAILLRHIITITCDTKSQKRWIAWRLAYRTDTIPSILDGLYRSSMCAMAKPGKGMKVFPRPTA